MTETAQNQYQGYPPQLPPQPGGPFTAQPETKSPLIALICGIFSFLGFGLLTGIPAIIFGVKGRKEADQGRNRSRGMATSGLVLGIISTTLSGIFLLLTVFAIPTFLHQRKLGVDASIKSDLKNMAVAQETYITDNPDQPGVSVAATTPGGPADVSGFGRVPVSPGNVIAVTVTPDGYCVSGYNAGASEATSPDASIIYRSNPAGIQAGVGTC